MAFMNKTAEAGAPLTSSAFLEAVQASSIQPVANPRPIVLVGAGGIARDAHLPAYRKASLPVIAVVDADLAKASSLARDFDIPYATNLIEKAQQHAEEEAIYDLAVPAPALLKVLPLLPDGAAVLIQKPMGETLQEAHAIVDLCHRKGLTAAVNFQLRWAPVMLAARKIADAGLIGQLHDIEIQVSVHMPWALWSFLSTAPRLEILYHSIHYIDLVRSWLGNPYWRLCENGAQPAHSRTGGHKNKFDDDGLWRVDARAYLRQPQPRLSALRCSEAMCNGKGTEGAMRAVMGVNLNYPRGKPDSLSYIRQVKIGTACGRLCRPREIGSPMRFIGSMTSLQRYVTGESETRCRPESKMRWIRCE
jgi:predicted dehydrogenase